jgi:hypothetical protein
VGKLSKRFIDSPRVDVLLGQLMEGRGRYEEAKAFYEGLLQRDETNVVRFPSPSRLPGSSD